MDFFRLIARGTYLSVDGAGEVDARALPPRQRGAALAHQRLVSVGELLEVLLQCAHSDHLNE